MITIYDSETRKYYTWTTGECKIDFTEEPLCNMPKESFVLYKFNDNEHRMLQHFVDWFEANSPSVIAGWNIQGYDIPYIKTE